MSHDQFCPGKELVVVCHVFTIFLPFRQMFFFSAVPATLALLQYPEIMTETLSKQFGWLIGVLIKMMVCGDAFCLILVNNL